MLELQSAPCSVVMAASEGLVRAYDRTLLVDHGGHITIMGYVTSKEDGLREAQGNNKVDI